jgi:hypothetical protein
VRRLRRARVSLAILLALTLAPTLTSAPIARAGGQIGTALTDFTQVTPATAMVYVAIQNTKPDQPRNLRRLGQDFKEQPGFAALERQFLKSAGLSGSSAGAINQVAAFLGHLFNGEIGMAVLPATVSTGANGQPTPRLHLLLEAGLQKGIGAAQLADTFALVGLPAKPMGSYRKLAIASFDLSKLAGSLQGAGMPSNTSISGVLYGTVAGNDAVLASDLPSIHQAIDTWYGAIPSIAATAPFQTTISALPADRFLTDYVHFDLRSLAQLGRALGIPRQSLAMLGMQGSFAEATSLTAEPDGILYSASPQLRSGAVAAGLSLSPTQLAEAGFLPDDTLVYAAVHDPAGLIRQGIEGIAAALRASSMCITANGVTKCHGVRQQDPIQQFNRATGLNFDNDVLSWMHGDASLALLPVGSAAFGAKSPLTRLSLVATLQVSDQGFVESRIAKINAALQKLGGPSASLALRFVDVTGAGGQPLHILAATPNGIGYTFYHGYLMLGTALPADVAALERGSAGHSLWMSPLYQAAFSHLANRPHGAVLFVNIAHLRPTLEQIARAMGTDMKSYNQLRPLLTAFKSLAAVTYAGQDAGGAVFLGIGR